MFLAISVFTVPDRCLAVRPRLCIDLIALGTGSYINTKSAAGTSNPSSPTDVAINTLISPFLNSSSLASCCFCVMPFCFPLVAWPMNLAALTPVIFDNEFNKLVTVYRNSVKISILHSGFFVSFCFTISSTIAAFGCNSPKSSALVLKLCITGVARNLLVARSPLRPSCSALSRNASAALTPWVLRRSNSMCIRRISEILFAAL